MLDGPTYTLWVNKLVELTLSRTVSKINVFFAEIQDGRRQRWEIDFQQKVLDDCVYQGRRGRVKNFPEIALSPTISEINVFSCFMQKFKMAALRYGGKAIFGKNASRRCAYPVGQKFRQNCSMSHRLWNIKAFFISPLKT